MKPALLTVTLLVAVGLAGCAQDPGPQVVVITDPDDFSYAGNNTTRPDVVHIHDYWDGAETLQVMDLDSGTGSTLFTRGSDGYRMTTFRPEAGNIIPLGASEVQVTIAWDEDPQGDPAYRLGDRPLELWIKTAADQAPEPFAEIESGDTVSVPTGNAQNDIPHQRLSAWEFVLAVPPAATTPDAPAVGDGGYGSYAIRVHIQVEAIRGLAIPPYPPHPDPWGDQSSVVVADIVHNFREIRVSTPVSSPGSDSNFDDPLVLDDGKIVPHDADYILLGVNLNQQSTHGLRFLYHGADDWEWQEAPAVEHPNWTHAYKIPVDGNGDSPYALQSVWRFWFEADRGDDESAWWTEGEFYLKATAHKGAV